MTFFNVFAFNFVGLFGIQLSCVIRDDAFYCFVHSLLIYYSEIA